MKWFRAVRDRAARVRTQTVKVAEQALDKARAAGRLTARKIVALQEAARLPRKLTERSLQTVRQATPAREADRAWRDGYVTEASRQPAPQPSLLAQSGLEPTATRGDVVTDDGSLLIVRDSGYFGTPAMHASWQADREAGR